ncbi:MAG: DUF1488 family protein [Rhizobacter sp.]|nr:DUF1488 family protein [Rhizobacter sp.]
MTQAPFFHADSGAVRFWVPIDDKLVGCSISRETLHHRFRPGVQGDDPLETFNTYSSDIIAAVKRRVAQGSIEPVMLREYDLRQPGTT